MLDIGFQEVLVLMVMALLIFGPDKLPDLGRRLGRAMREFRRASDEFRSTIETNLQITDESILPPSASVTTSSETSAPDPVVATPSSGGDPVGATADAPAGQFEESAAAAGALPEDPFCAQRGGKLLHRTSCEWVRRIPDAERIAVKAASEGWDLGLRACPVCDPQGAPA
jgi:TatA/E family protein of Tat protein translocase